MQYVQYKPRLMKSGTGITKSGVDVKNDAFKDITSDTQLTLWLTMNVVPEFENALRINEHFTNALGGMPLGSGVRNRTAAGLLYLSMQHFDSILILMDNQRHGSAAALVRPQYETMIRGSWFFHCATEAKIESFLDGGKAPGIKEMIGNLEKLPGYDAGQLSRIHAKVWGIMNSYTHGGSEQAHYHNSETDIGVNFQPETLREIVRSCSAIALSSANVVAIISGNLEVARQLIDRFNQEFR